MSVVPPVSSQLTTELIEFRRTLHEHPELSLEEYETTKRIRTFLHAHDIEVLDYELSTGVLAIVRGRTEGPCIAVRADIDALPIFEQTGLPFASKTDGKMHACGHDFHTSAVLGAAVMMKALADSPASFAGSVLFVFQAAEETGAGAPQIIESGVFKDFNVKAIIGEHNQPLLSTGKIGVKAGPLMASVAEFDIVITGKGGHAAIPELTIDPILIASHVVTGLQHIVSRNTSPHDAVVVTVGKFTAGTARNVIPPNAMIEGTVRCLQPENQSFVEERIRSFVTQTVEAFGGQVEIAYRRVLPGVVNDESLAVVVQQAAEQVVGKGNVVLARPSMGGEDFAIYQQTLPGCFFWVGTGKPDGSSQGWHHPEFDVDESMIPVTSRVFVEAATAWLKQSTDR